MKYTLGAATFLVLFAAAPVVHAAQLAIDPPSLTLAAGQDATVSLVIASSDDINTIGTAVPLPAGLRYLRAQPGIVVEQWIQLPGYDSSAGELMLSGIMPRGWHGKGVFALVTVEAQKAGTYALAYDPQQTEVYYNDGSGTMAPVTFGAISTAPPVWSFAVGAVALILVVLFFLRKKIRLTFL